MEIKRIKKKGKNIYTLFYTVGFWIFKKEQEKDVFVYSGYVYYCSNNKCLESKSKSIINLINHLISDECLEVK